MQALLASPSAGLIKLLTQIMTSLALRCKALLPASEQEKRPLSDMNTGGNRPFMLTVKSLCAIGRSFL